MSSTFGWNVSPQDSQLPNNTQYPQYPPQTIPNNGGYPAYPMAAPAGNPYPPQSPIYFDSSQEPPPYRTAQSTFYVNGPELENSNSNSNSTAEPPRSPPPPYIDPGNNNYPSTQQYPLNAPVYPPPVGTQHAQYPPPVYHQQSTRNGNDLQSGYNNNNNSSTRYNPVQGENRTQFSENNNNNNTTGIYPQVPNFQPPGAAVDSNNHSQKPRRYSKSETPLPPKSFLLWQGSRQVKLYFVQREGHVVSPDRDLSFTAYKCSPMNDISSCPPGSLAGNARNATVLVKAENVWRLGISKERSYIARGIQGEYGFYDDSTSPARCVVIVFQKDLKKEEKQRLDVLLTGSSLMSDEPSNVVDRFESGVGSVFDSFANSVDNTIKKQTPDIHKKTRWVRKTTGQAVRFGGSLVSKGVHLVSDNVMDKEKPKEATPTHQEIFAALGAYRFAVEKKRVSRVSSYR